MKLTTKAVCSLLAGSAIAGNVSAEEYEWELDVAYGGTNFDGSKTITTTGGTIFNSGSNDSDSLSIFGNWYFSGLSDVDGPRARAELVSRASSLRFGYGRTERTITSLVTNNDPNLPFIPSLDSRFESESQQFAVALRYVDPDSGWFGDVGLQISEDTFRDTFGGFGSSSVDTTEFQLGFGKYIYENTTLSFGVGRVDFGLGEKATAFDISLEHLGDLGERWQYGVDVGYDRTDGDFSDVDALGVAISLYPTRDFEFGVGFTDARGNPGISRSDVSYDAFASWFVKPNIQLSANYRFDDVDYLGNVFIGGVRDDSEADGNAFGISATWRFD